MPNLISSFAELRKLGPLPDDKTEIADGVLERYDELLNEIKDPPNISEAIVLAGLFPSTSCFGMEWTLVHLLEKSADWPSIAINAIVSKYWKLEMLQRIERGRAL
jgi:hypothetical protein